MMNSWVVGLPAVRTSRGICQSQIKRSSEVAFMKLQQGNFQLSNLTVPVEFPSYICHASHPRKALPGEMSGGGTREGWQWVLAVVTGSRSRAGGKGGGGCWRTTVELFTATLRELTLRDNTTMEFACE